MLNLKYLYGRYGYPFCLFEGCIIDECFLARVSTPSMREDGRVRGVSIITACAWWCSSLRPSFPPPPPHSPGQKLISVFPLFFLRSLPLAYQPPSKPPTLWINWGSAHKKLETLETLGLSVVMRQSQFYNLMGDATARRRCTDLSNAASARERLYRRTILWS